MEKRVNYQCKNTIVTSSNDEENPIERLEVLLQKLTVGLDENTKARAEAEYKQRESEILLNEIMSSLKECKHLVSEQGSKSSRSFNKVCSLLEKVAMDRSDLSVFKEGIHTLRQNIQRRMVRRWDDLPPATQITVDRIVAKLDITEWLQFARILKVSPASLKIDPESFDDDMKTRVFVEWVEQSHEHNEVVLLSLVEGRVEEKCAEVTRGYKEQCFSKPLTSNMSANSHTPTKTAAGDLGAGHNREVPPDSRTMIEHMKILMEFALDTNSKVELVLKHQEAVQLMLTKT
ncbi:uncharacterized protein LOC128213877 [Mya arenaria]|uniref:uncharacterized protein LOC128213877 n=1 Tax=Mya arenaria TaxID=6604 RepID=UPI0022E3535C|nr:uncharacterized protein LOC128213877 [Mya arenaria]